MTSVEPAPVASCATWNASFSASRRSRFNPLLSCPQKAFALKASRSKPLGTYVVSGFSIWYAFNMKRTRLRKDSKQSISLIQRKIWVECKRIIRKKYGNICFTCRRTNLVGSNWHTGHLLAKASIGAYLKYDIRLLRPQCYNCNINLGGNGAIFIENLRRIEGNGYVDQILKDRQVTVKAYDHYLTLLEKYINL